MKFEQLEVNSEQTKNELKQAYNYRDTELQRFEDEMRRLTLYYDQEVEKKKNKILEMKNLANEAEYDIQSYGKELDRLKRDLVLQEQEIRLGQEAKKQLESQVIITRELEHKLT